MNQREEKSPAIACLCFSKDRPIQLEGYIKSLQRFASEKIPITIIYCVSNERFRAAYDKLIGLFPDVEFILEKNFRRHVTRWIKTTETPYLLFGVDDWIFRKSFDVSIIEETFKNPELYGFSLRLGLEMTYSGMLQKAIARPRFFKRYPYLLWNWDEDPSHLDWSYPFEICATVYRRESILRILAMLETGKIEHPHWKDMSSKNWGHPNRFEAFASVAVRLYDSGCPKKMASFPDAKGSLVTVNRVQEECENFVCGEAQEMDTEELLEPQNHWFISRLNESSSSRMLDVGTNIELMSAASAIIPATTFQMRMEELQFEKLEDKSQSLVTSLSFIESIGMGQYGEEPDPATGIKTFRKSTE